MERRQFLAGSIGALLFNALRPITGKIKEKTCVIGIGTAGSKIAQAIYKALPYEVNYYSVDSTNNNHLQTNDHVTCWYHTKIQKYPEAFKPVNEDELAEDWEYNLQWWSFFREKVNAEYGNVIVITAMGGTGSYVSWRLITELIKKKKNNVYFIGTHPFSFEGKRRAYISNKYFQLIKDTGVKTMNFDCRDSTKAKGNVTLKEAFDHMDKLLINKTKNILKNI